MPASGLPISLTSLYIFLSLSLSDFSHFLAHSDFIPSIIRRWPAELWANFWLTWPLVALFGQKPKAANKSCELCAQLDLIMQRYLSSPPPPKLTNHPSIHPAIIVVGKMGKWGKCGGCCEENWAAKTENPSKARKLRYKKKKTSKSTASCWMCRKNFYYKLPLQIGAQQFPKET